MLDHAPRAASPPRPHERWRAVDMTASDEQSGDTAASAASAASAALRPGGGGKSCWSVLHRPAHVSFARHRSSPWNRDGVPIGAESFGDMPDGHYCCACSCREALTRGSAATARRAEKPDPPLSSFFVFSFPPYPSLYLDLRSRPAQLGSIGLYSSSIAVRDSIVRRRKGVWGIEFGEHF